MTMGHRPDDVLGPEGGIAAEEHFGMSRGHARVDFRHIPFIELDPDVALDPGEGILLHDGDKHIIAGKMLVRIAGWNERAPSLAIEFGPDLLEQDAGETAILVGEFFRYQEIEDRDVFVHGVL